jgi:hypothetical protein
VSHTGLAQGVPPSYNHDFVTIGAAGNRGTLPDERPWTDLQDPPVGSVAYEFRITRTEITASQWLEFANAYRPFASANDRVYLGAGVLNDPFGTYELIPPFASHCAQPTFNLAARYCNWLHNNKSTTFEAFQGGAYDASLFQRDANDRLPAQGVRLPGAQFWIPNLDEVIKAFYFDPHRYGENDPGYWLHPSSSNIAPISLPPQLGGTTNSGVTDVQYWRVGAYPSVTTPWGLLDASGGGREMTETLDLPGVPNWATRYVIGSSKGGDPGFAEFEDRIDAFLNAPNLAASRHAFRVASIVPSVSTFIPIFAGLILLQRKRT